MSRRTQKNVGVIGLGIIGQRVADCLRRRGFHVFVWNRTPRPFPNFVGSPAELAELCDFVQIFVSNDEALLQMIGAMKPSLSAHHVVMAHCTVAPETMREAADLVARRGGQLLDAPFTGSKEAAGRGELVYYIGGDEAAYRRARPVLEASSKEILEIGEVGQATTIKLATNMITAATVQVAAEALALVDRAQVPLDKFAAAMRSNGSNSGTLTMKLPKMIDREFDTHFSVKHMLKDATLAARMGRDLGLRLGVTEVARDVLRDELNDGGGEADYSAVMRQYFPEAPAPSLPLMEEEAADPEPVEEPVEADPESEPEAAPEPEAEPDVEEIELLPNESPMLTAAATEEAPPALAEAKPEEKKEVEPRGFLSRIFSRGADY